MASGAIPARTGANLQTADYPPAREGWRVVAVLTTVGIFAFIDRQILSLLVGPIRRDLNLTDTQMSLLLGFSFAFFFTVFAIPLGRIADRKSRRAVLGAGLASWSLCTTICGFARTFGQMFLLRAGVGMSEATLGPCAYSIISDSFPEERRATALSVFSTSICIGSGLAFLAGGLVIRFAAGRETWELPLAGPVRPWQLVLIEIGIAGLLSTLLLLTIREPLRREAASGGAVRIREAMAYVSRNRKTFLCHHLGFAMVAMAVTAGAAWIPELFRRNFGWSAPKFGLYFGIEAAVFGCLGVIGAGRIADRLFRRGLADASLRVGAWIAGLGLLFSSLVFLAPSGNIAILWLACGAAMMSAPYGVAAAALQQSVPGEIRSQATALYLIVANLLGAATGPTLTAALTQHVFRREDSLPYSLLLVHLFGLGIGAALLWAGRGPLIETINRLKDRRP